MTTFTCISTNIALYRALRHNHLANNNCLCIYAYATAQTHSQYTHTHSRKHARVPISLPMPTQVRITQLVNYQRSLKLSPFPETVLFDYIIPHHNLDLEDIVSFVYCLFISCILTRLMMMHHIAGFSYKPIFDDQKISGRQNHDTGGRVSIQYLLFLH